MIAGNTFGLVGALAAFPRRLAVKAIKLKGGELQHRVTRRTTHVVLGRALLDKAKEPALTGRIDAEAAAGRVLISENALLRGLGLVPEEAGSLSRQALLDQARLSPRDLDMLTLFDAFERHAEPYSFRDLILARKYKGLIAGGATWSAIARSIHRSGPVASLTALSLHADGGDSIYARLGDAFTELDGQGLLPLDRAEDNDLEELFAAAEDAEDEGRAADAAVLYGRCLAIDATDAVAAFNQANCLKAAGQPSQASHAYLRAVKLDPKFCEAWFNFAGLLREQGNVDAARRHLKRATTIDPAYADAVFNLASLEFDAGALAEARRWWQRYLTLDTASEWADTARKGIHYADVQLRARTAS